MTIIVDLEKSVVVRGVDVDNSPFEIRITLLEAWHVYNDLHMISTELAEAADASRASA